MSEADAPTYEDFCASWLDEITANEPTSIEKGRRFARKLIADWMDLDQDSVEITYCDGTGDGGIDAAILDRGAVGGGDESEAGDAWLLIQSKFGSAFAGDATLLTEGKKVIDTLDGQHERLSSLSEDVVAKLGVFRQGAGELDQIRLVFATTDPLTEAQRRTLEDVRHLGRQRLGNLFDVQAISLRDIYDAQLEEIGARRKSRLTVPLTGHLAAAGDDLLVGSVKLLDLYVFLKAYQSKTGNLDQLYEKNVRRFLGGRVKVNRGMQDTLRNLPERFGLYNNGITVVVSEFKSTGSGSFDLAEPYVVNGCQTTRTIWQICDQYLDAGGKGANPALAHILQVSR